MSSLQRMVLLTRSPRLISAACDVAILSTMCLTASLHRRGFAVTADALFRRSPGLDWLIANKAAADATAAAALGQRLQDSLLLRHVSDTVAFSRAAPGDLFRLRSDAPLSGGPLNGARAWRGAPRPAPVLATDLRQRIVELYDTFLSPDGRYVDYQAMVRRRACRGRSCWYITASTSASERMHTGARDARSRCPGFSRRRSLTFSVASSRPQGSSR